MYLGKELSFNSWGRTHSQSSQLIVLLWTDPLPKRVQLVHANWPLILNTRDQKNAFQLDETGQNLQTFEEILFFKPHTTQKQKNNHSPCILVFCSPCVSSCECIFSHQHKYSCCHSDAACDRVWWWWDCALCLMFVYVLCKFVSGLILWSGGTLWFDDLQAE